MKKIIQNYKETRELSKEDIEYLEKKGIINGIGGKNSTIARVIDAVQKLPFYNTWKHRRLVDDIEYQSYKHDFDYYIGKNYFHFTKANIRFAWNVKNLFKWTRWYWRIVIFIFILVGTQVYGYKYFK